MVFDKKKKDFDFNTGVKERFVSKSIPTGKEFVKGMESIAKKTKKFL